MCSRRRHTVTSGCLTFFHIALVFAVFCHQIGFGNRAPRRKLARAKAPKKASKTNTKKPHVIVPPYPKTFFPDSLYESVYEAPEFVFEGHPSELVINCLPPGGMEPKNKQMYDWRFTDGRGVINNKRFQADSKVGTLTIFKPDNDTDGYYKCNIVMPDESIVAYRHTVLTVKVPVFKNFALLNIAIRLDCGAQDTENTLIRLTEEVKDLVCSHTVDNCLYEISSIKGSTTAQLIDEAGHVVDVCFCLVHIVRLVEKSYVRDNNCQNMACIRDGYVNHLTTQSQIQAKLKALFDALTKQFKENVNSAKIIPASMTERIFGFCPNGYRIHKEIVCVPCEPGTMATQNTENVNIQQFVCVKCEESMYNDKLHQMMCTPCPKGKVVTSDSINCIDPKTISGQVDVNMVKLVAESEEVNTELGQDHWMKAWARKQWANDKVQIGLIAGVNLLILILFAVCLYKCNKKRNAKRSAMGESEDDPSMQKLLFKAAAEVQRKKEITEEMTKRQRIIFEAMNPKQQKEYLDAAFKREKVQMRLEEIKMRPLGGVTR